MLGTVNVTPLAKLPLVLVLTEAGVVVSAAVSNLKPETVELPAKPAPWIETVAPGLAGVPTVELLGVSVRPGVTVNAVPVAVTDSFCWSIANSVLLPSGTFGTAQLPVACVPRIVPSGVAVRTHTTSVSNVVLPICTKMLSPAVQPAPVTDSVCPGEPDPGETDTFGAA